MGDVLVLIPIVCSLGLFAMIAVIAIAGSNSRKEQAKIHADVQTKLIDKFGSAPEFITFLSSPAGRQFMVGAEAGTKLMARDRILRGVRSATVLSCLGLAFFLIAALGFERDMYFPGFILLGLGGGYLISTIVMVRLSKSWGLFEERAPEPPAYPPAPLSS